MTKNYFHVYICTYKKFSSDVNTFEHEINLVEKDLCSKTLVKIFSKTLSKSCSFISAISKNAKFEILVKIIAIYFAQFVSSRLNSLLT